jgi:hypothetical protein
MGSGVVLMKREFKVGEKIVAYEKSHRYIGKIGGFYPDGVAMVMMDNNTGNHFHPKQMRHLKKKGRRRVWISSLVFKENLTNQIPAYQHLPDGLECKTMIEFIEVKK